MVVVFGNSYGFNDASPKLRNTSPQFVNSVMKITLWKADTTTVAKTASSAFFQLTMLLTVAHSKGSVSQLYSFHMPTVSSTATTNYPCSGQFSITIVGQMFGHAPISNSVKLGCSIDDASIKGGSTSSASTWKSSSSIASKITIGNGVWTMRQKGYPIIITAGMQQGNRRTSVVL